MHRETATCVFVLGLIASVAAEIWFTLIVGDTVRLAGF
jgi:hypothetical protein